MAFYRFQIESPLPPEAVAERLRAITRKPLSYVDSFRSRAQVAADPFLFQGSVSETGFMLKRNIAYRNPFLPRAAGRIGNDGSQTKVQVTLFMSPMVFLLVVCWLVLTGEAAHNLTLRDPAHSLMPWAMFLLVLALSMASFFPEAFKARRLIRNAVQETHTNEGRTN